MNRLYQQTVSFLLDRIEEDKALAAVAETDGGWWTLESLELNLRLRVPATPN